MKPQTTYRHASIACPSSPTVRIRWARAPWHGNAGQAADLTAFSFHAVKNFTTAEGGALTWRPGVLDDEAAYKQLMLMSLHGQTKDALAKDKAGAWEYDIAYPGWKCNMTDMQAALGLAQLRRYPACSRGASEIVERYEAGLADAAYASAPLRRAIPIRTVSRRAGT